MKDSKGRKDMTDNILKQIMTMGKGENETFKLTDNRYLFVDNWECTDWYGNREYFTSLELDSGYDDNCCYELEEVLECVTCDFGDKEDIEKALEYLVLCCE